MQAQQCGAAAGRLPQRWRRVCSAARAAPLQRRRAAPPLRAAQAAHGAAPRAPLPPADAALPLASRRGVSIAGAALALSLALARRADAEDGAADAEEVELDLESADPAQREAAARLAASLAAKTARRGGLAKAAAEGRGTQRTQALIGSEVLTRTDTPNAAPAPSSMSSPLEVGTAFVTAAWVGGFALAAVALQRSGRLGGGGGGDSP